jgi:hypothetical protein
LSSSLAKRSGEAAKRSAKRSASGFAGFAGFADGMRRRVYILSFAVGQQFSMSPNIYFKNLNQFLEQKKENRTNQVG